MTILSTSELRARKKRDEVKTALASTSRALASRDSLRLNFDDFSTYAELERDDLLRVAFPESDAELERIRGEIDSKSLFLRYHNKSLHRKFIPQDRQGVAIYNAMENARVESLGIMRMRGIRENINTKTVHYMEAQGYARLSETADPPLGDILSLIMRERLTGQAPPHFMADMVKLWGAWLEKIAPLEMQQIASSADSQEVFASLASKIIQQISINLPSMRAENSSDSSAPENAEEISAELDSDSQEDGEAQDMEDSSLETGDDGKSEEQSLGLLSTNVEDNEQSNQINRNMPSEEADNQHPEYLDMLDASSYHVFTSIYDELAKPQDLANADELTRLRAQLDDKLTNTGHIVSKLANRLQRKLMAKQARSWEFDQEDGLINASRLSRLVVNPREELIYKREKQADFKDTVITLLIDNSGSMRGRPISVAAMTTDILARTLERCGVKVEILGFTTREWKGGRSRKRWMEAGCPSNPGRLNDVRHILYKPADMPWRLARRNLGLMLKEGILKENIDGEALLWAYSRISRRPEQRRIIMVISDGAPVDDSTISANTSNYLDMHLRDAIHFIEARPDAELLAIGIGHDVARYYSRATKISDVDNLARVMTGELEKLFG